MSQALSVDDPPTEPKLQSINKIEKVINIRKIIVSMFLTLDDVMHASNEWAFPFWNDEPVKK